MRFLKIKWETVIVTLLGINTIFTFSIYQTMRDDWRMLVLAAITSAMLIVSIIFYQDIKNFRHEVLKLWK